MSLVITVPWTHTHGYTHTRWFKSAKTHCDINGQHPPHPTLYPSLSPETFAQPRPLVCPKKKCLCTFTHAHSHAHADALPLRYCPKSHPHTKCFKTDFSVQADPSFSSQALSKSLSWHDGLDQIRHSPKVHLMVH